MKISGKDIAESIYQRLRKQSASLIEKGITPHLVVILVGDDPASVAYVRQKKIHGEAIGIKVTIKNYPKTVQQSELTTTIHQFNNDTSTHGIIIQQPLPPHIDASQLVTLTSPTKDVDGFHPDSQFTPPIAEAVVEILTNIYSVVSHNEDNFLGWLKSKSIVVVGKGETGGIPIKNKFKKLGVYVKTVDSKTENPDEITKKADIIVSCVGKPHILTKNKLKNGVILLSVGMYKGDDNKLHGDYEPEEVEDIASFYTPVPGGVGPVNVAMLLSNVVTSAKT